VAKVTVIGAGLAGSEAAWQIAQSGIDVDLYEMRPLTSTPAHHSDLFAELVCSNSLRAANVENAVGLLKEEMRQLNSLILKAADLNKVPAGGALAVDRQGFSQYITDVLTSHPRVTVHHTEVSNIPDCYPVVIASGPLTSPALSAAIAQLAGHDYLYFYDAAAPIVVGESLDMDKIYRASRYGKGDEDLTRIYHCLQSILSRAIQLGGVYDIKFSQDDMLTGNYIPHLKVAYRTGAPCYECSSPIQTKRVGGRNAFYCTNCQH